MAMLKREREALATRNLKTDARETQSSAAEVERRVAVVILTYNRLHYLLGTVERLLRLPERPQIVVVDNGSADGTPEAIASRFPMVEIIRLKHNIGAAGRNVGVQHVRTPFVALCDDDTWWAPGSLKRAADLLEAYPRLALLTGRLLVGREEKLDPTCSRMAASPLCFDPGLPGPAILGFLAGASVVRRSAFLEVGGFEPRFFMGGEEVLAAVDLVAAGWGLVYADQIVAYHHPTRYRDALTRRRLLTRNALWFTWLRRPAASALQSSLQTFCSAARDPVSARGFFDALAGLPWVLKNRRVVPPHIEEALKQLQEQNSPRRRSFFGAEKQLKKLADRFLKQLFNFNV
jgi:GT2 family glycosyltransferase